MNLTRKILESHLVEGEWKSGSEIGIRIDQTLTQDATGTMAYLQFEAMGIDRLTTELSVSYIDHNTLQIGFENADDHRYLLIGRAQVRDPTFASRQRHLPPSPPRALRQARRHASRLRQPYPDRRWAGHGGHRRRRPRRGPRNGRLSLLPALSRGYPHNNQGEIRPLGFGQGPRAQDAREIRY